MSKRYAVECDSPDGGYSTYAECWGQGGNRGRVLSKHDTLEEAVQACDGNPATDTRECRPWIWDRRKGCVVSARRVKAVQAD